MANWFGLTVDTSGVRVETGPKSWQITREPTFGVTWGLVYGPLRRPLSLRGLNPWTVKADLVIRFPWVVLPWFHIWWWHSRDALDFPDQRPHPIRFYAGGKLFEAHNRPGEDVWRDAVRDPVGWYIAPSISFRDADFR